MAAALEPRHARPRNVRWVRWVRSLTPAERRAYAKRAGTTAAYIEQWYLPFSERRRKNPRLHAMRRLAEATEGKVSLHDVVEHFLPELVEERIKLTRAIRRRQRSPKEFQRELQEEFFPEHCDDELGFVEWR